jgi:hypothetical protein
MPLLILALVLLLGVPSFSQIQNKSVEIILKQGKDHYCQPRIW